MSFEYDIVTTVELTDEEKKVIKPTNERFHIYSMDFNNISKLSIGRLKYMSDELAGKKTIWQWKNTGTWIRFKDMLLINSDHKRCDRYLDLAEEFFNLDSDSQVEYYKDVGVNDELNEDEKYFMIHLGAIYAEVLRYESYKEIETSIIKDLLNKHAEILKILEHQRFSYREFNNCDDTAEDIIDLKINDICDKIHCSDEIADELYSVAESFYHLGKIFGKQIERHKKHSVQAQAAVNFSN